MLSYRIAEKKPKFSFHPKLAWELFHYGKYITGAGILIFLTTRLDDGLLGKFLGMEELGFYINAYFFCQSSGNAHYLHAGTAHFPDLLPLQPGPGKTKPALPASF
jgi:hypothetical protein